MLKRTKGCLLLTLLVTTGLAGTLNNGSLSQKERKQAIALIKNSRNEILGSINGLSPGQINYKPSSKDPSIGELIIKMVSLEKNCSLEIRTMMDQPSNPETRLKIALKDEQLLENNNYPFCEVAVSGDAKTPRNDLAETLKKFLVLRTSHIKYIRTSTEDLRNHVVATPAGWIDCYQYYLLLADRSSHLAEKINLIRSSSHFPKK
jgi:hypothetical protein